MQGTRVAEEVTPDELSPGHYNLRGGILWARTPNGTLCRIDERWSVTEEFDGSITVGPVTPGGNSSIEVHGAGPEEYWHGYLRRGVWQSL